jgi:hypothetical protein
MRKSLVLLPALLLCLFAAASQAVNVPLPTKEATLNIQIYIQPRLQLTENGTPDGQSMATDLFVRRTRLQANGNVGDNWLYLFQVDNANFGRYGNYTGRMIVQDAWASWGPFGTKGDNVLLVEGGLVFFPQSRFTIMSSGNYPSIDGHPDLVRGLTASQFPANRTTGLQVRGWALDKKIGFRGGVYEGVQPAVAANLNPKRYPAVAMFLNFDFIGSEEGTYLYQGILFGKNPVLSMSVAGAYQSQALVVPKGVTDMKSLTSTIFFDYPLSEKQEFVVTVGGYLFGNGTGSKDSGLGLSLDAGFRFDFVQPYASYEFFDAKDCSAPGDVSVQSQCAQAHTADSRNFRGGLKFYFNKSLNHVDLEFALNRGQSTVGPTSITAATAGYLPGGLSTAALANLGRSPTKTLVMQWTAIF